MEPVSCTLRVDDRSFHLEFRGFDQALDARLDDGRELRLQPWTLGRHLRALGQAARVVSGELRLDGDALAAEVLGPERDDAWAPLALWWAAGGLAQPVDEPPPGYAVRACSWAERAGAVMDNSPEEGLDLAGFVAALVRACVSAAPELPSPLDCPEGARLIDALAHRNAPATLLPPAMEDPALKAATLALVRATGRTPSEVWAAPAVEMDRVMALMGSAPSAPRPTPRPAPRPARTGLSAFPDAVLIQVEDD